MARTTAVELKGDRYKAEQLSLAHTNRLLRTFRENSAFQSLQQNKHEENFFDETGAYIGKISMQTVFGVEKVIVDVRSGKPRPQKEEWVLRTRQVSQVVPCIRSADNLWWVACLSGTFEGPYYAFKNIYEISAAEMDDNVEIELDKKLISIGGASLSGGEPPKLFFIAQTGKRDTGTTTNEDYINLYEDPLYSATNDLTYDTVSQVNRNHLEQIPGRYEWCDASLATTGFPWVAMYDDSFSYEQPFVREVTHSGEIIPVPPLKFRTYHNRAGIWGTNTAISDLDYQIQGLPSNLYEYTSTTPRSFYGAGYDAFDHAIPYYKGISIEPGDVSNFAAGYSALIIAQVNNWDQPGTCLDLAIGSALPWDYRGVFKRSYCFHVNDKVLVFHNPPDFYDHIQFVSYLYFRVEITGVDDEEADIQHELYCPSNALKYYGKEDSEKAVGLMCGIAKRFTINFDTGYPENREYLGFYYNFIGPNTDGVSTPFIPDNMSVREHIIPGITYEGEDIIFKGEIFLGMIQYTVTEKKQVYS